MYEFSHCQLFSYPQQSGSHAWVQGLLMMAFDAMVRGGSAAAMRYGDAVATAQAVYGVNAPCYLVDPETYSLLSDVHKDCYGVRYRGDCSRSEALAYIDQIGREIDMQIQDEQREAAIEAEMAVKRSFGSSARPTAMELAFASARTA